MDLNETDFLEALTAEVQRRCEGISVANAKTEAGVILKEMLEGEGVEFGDDQYDWSRGAAADLAGAFLD